MQLAEREVHVWKVELERPASSIEYLRRFLVADEVDRAQRFYFEKDRNHWTVAHAFLRIFLGRYLLCDPSELDFATNSYGKPAVVAPSRGNRLHFNLSHSGDLALFAFAYDKEVGVDLERMRSGIEYRDLATRVFSAVERAALDALDPFLQEEAFFLCWSRKEAYIKARGMGLSLPLEQFDVSLTPGEPARLLGSREVPPPEGDWSLHALFPADGYAGALVTDGADWQIRCWRAMKIPPETD